MASKSSGLSSQEDLLQRYISLAYSEPPLWHPCWHDWCPILIHQKASVRNGRAGRKSSDTCHTFPCAIRTTQSPVLGASMPRVLFLGARKIVFSTYVHGLRAYHALNQYRIRYEDMRCKSLVLAPLRLFGL